MDPGRKAGGICERPKRMAAALKGQKRHRSIKGRRAWHRTARLLMQRNSVLEPRHPSRPWVLMLSGTPRRPVGHCTTRGAGAHLSRRWALLLARVTPFGQTSVLKFAHLSRRSFGAKPKHPALDLTSTLTTPGTLSNPLARLVYCESPRRKHTLLITVAHVAHPQNTPRGFFSWAGARQARARNEP